MEKAGFYCPLCKKHSVRNSCALSCNLSNESAIEYYHFSLSDMHLPNSNCYYVVELSFKNI